MLYTRFVALLTHFGAILWQKYTFIWNRIKGDYKLTMLINRFNIYRG